MTEQKPRSVLQPWVSTLSLMQQAVLLCAIRGPDGIRKEHPAKLFLRWFRRCVLIRAFDGLITPDPHAPGGGSFTGAWPDDITYEGAMALLLKHVDELPHHFVMHLMHAAEILGYKHPQADIRYCWRIVYFDMCKWMHLTPETVEHMDMRLGDNEKQWRKTEVHFARDETSTDT